MHSVVFNTLIPLLLPDAARVRGCLKIEMGNGGRIENIDSGCVFMDIEALTETGQVKCQ